MGNLVFKKFLYLLTVLLAFGLLQGLAVAGTAQAEGLPITSVDAPAPVIEPAVVNDNNDTKVLFDNTHGQTAGAADWVINGAFSDFGQAIAGEGYYVKELRQTTPITYEDLSDYQVFVIPEANIPYKDSEQDAILNFVENGGSVFYIADHYNADRNLNRWDSAEIFNDYRRGAFDDPDKGFREDEINAEAMQGVSNSDWLSDHFGVRFRFNAIGDGVANDITAPNESFGVTEGVEGVAFHAGATIAITDPSKAKGLVYVPEGVSSWGPAVDQGVYNGGGRDEGAFVAISKVGQGKAAFIGDSSPVEDRTPVYLREDNGNTKTTYDGFKEADDGVLLTNLINWLAEQEDYQNLEGQGIELDQPTELHDFEIPENSTEPETEPWNNPPSGYKWYDRTTFQPGSYGSEEEAVNPTYSLVYQDTLPGDMQEFQIRLTGEQLERFSTTSDFRLGIYLDGGTQVGQFSLDGEHWTSNYGYSDYFELTADDQGTASETLFVRIKAGVSGEANLRVKKGSANLITETVTIDPDVEPEELPEEDTPELPEASAINLIRQMEDGQQVSAQGTIVSEPGLYGAQGFYLQDETGGIYVYQSQDGLQAGDIVSVSGELTTYNTEKEIINPTIKKIEAKDVPEPKIVDELSEANQGQLVRMNGVTIQNIRAAGSSFEFDAVTELGTTTVRVDGRTGITLDKFPYAEGDTTDLTGISAIWQGNFQLKPRSFGDLNYVHKLAEVRELGSNQQVTVQGTVTTAAGLWGAQAFYIQDQTGGLYVYQTEKDVKQGDLVQLSGTTAIYNGELELVDISSFEILGTDSLPDPVIVAPDALKEYQGMLVKVNMIEITELHEADNYGTTEFTAVNSAGESVVVRLDNRTGTDYDSFPYQDGDTVSIKGIASVFNDTYQLKPRNIDDLSKVDSSTLEQLVKQSEIHPRGIKQAILAKLKNAENKNKHYNKLIHFIENQPDKHIGSELKAELIHMIKVIQ
ncbi:DUF5689 domain-containing protein [Sediminibacillus albus]|uniref:DNA/RNA endonuclease YhcR, contains UshA esterase domain n=1 Tax=Sediminibacillus albus TaxID=407036 RepID=A0A1G9AKS7_9BACI|nr:DUF5689 domain-containing protein [Sediminibacillus albus]SDK27434.1 DNA/RNA endonuclease YhcR, contains UshA esterase domain [Sediminibacillus albus]